MTYCAPYLLAFLSTCYALTLGPESTLGHGLHPQGWTPRPTPAPEYKLVGRGETVQTLVWAEDNTCGYLSGLESSSFTCDGGRCAYSLSSGKSWGNVQCCSTAPCSGSSSHFLCVNCNFPILDCIDAVDYYTYGDCDDACEIDSYTLKCTESSEPFCNTLVYPDVIVTDIRCGANDASSVLTVLRTFSGEAEQTFYTQTFLMSGGAPQTGILSQDPSNSIIPLKVSDNSLDSTVLASSNGSTHTSPTTSGLSIVATETTANASDGLIASSSPTSSVISNTALPTTTHFLGPILGGVLGGTLFLALLTACICSCRKRRSESPNNHSSNPEINELEAPHPSTQPVFHELHEEGAPTFAWHKLWKPTFSYQSRCSDAVPDSPTLGRHPRTDLSGRLLSTISSQSIPPISPATRQELPADDPASSQQAECSEQSPLDRATVSPLSASSGAMCFELRTPVMNRGAFHQDRLQNSDSIEKEPATEGVASQSFGSLHEIQ